MGAAIPGAARASHRDAEPIRGHEFLPAYLRIQQEPPSPLPRHLLYCLLALLVCLVLWSVFGRLDIVASADGKLVPRSYLKIVQPADGGVVREILVEEGATVLAGQPLLRLDPSLGDADARTLRHDVASRLLQARRIEAELAGTPLARLADDSEELWTRARAQFDANRKAYQDSLELEAANVARLDKELRAANEALTKLVKTVPIYRSSAERFATLRKEGFVSELYQLEREREYIEKDQDLRAQAYTVESLGASLEQARSRLAQVTSTYRQQLHAERATVEPLLKKATEELAKQQYRNALVELSAPQSGIVKDLAAHTPGTVVTAGSVLLTLVPHGEDLQADVMVRNLDVGFVRPGQVAKVKVVAYPFQKYGTMTGTVLRVTPDAIETQAARSDEVDAEGKATTRSTYRARIALASQRLAVDRVDLALVSGMQVTAEINLGERSVLEYLLAPAQKAWLEAARER